MMILEKIGDIFLTLPYWTKALIGTAALVTSSYVALSIKNKNAWPGKWSRDRKSPYKKDFKSGMVYLYQFPRSRVIPSVSPFCLKVETWLRMTDIEYENVPIPVNARSKEGRLPFVELNGKEYADSALIIRDLSQLLNKNQIDDQLTDQQKAIGRAFLQMVEQSATPSYFYVRYLKKFNEIATENIFGSTFATLNKIPGFRAFFQDQMRKRLEGHGIGRHSEEDVVKIGLEDIQAVSTYLGDKKFFFGDQPSSIDAALFGFFAQLLYIPIDFPQKRFVETECKNLIGYCERMKKLYWSDWDEICQTLSMNTNYKKVDVDKNVHT